MAATDIGDVGPPPQFLQNTFKRRQPVGNEVIMVSWTEEASHGAKHTASMITPGNATAGLEGLLHAGLGIGQ